MVAHFHVGQSTVSKLLGKARVHGYVKDHPGSGYPHLTDAYDDAYIINEIEAMPLKQLQNAVRSNIYTHPNARCLSRLSRIASMQPLSRHAWDILHTAASGNVFPAPAGLNNLLLHLQIEWANIPKRKITKLMRSMNSRARIFIASQGSPTHY